MSLCIRAPFSRGHRGSWHSDQRRADAAAQTFKSAENTVAKQHRTSGGRLRLALVASLAIAKLKHPHHLEHRKPAQRVWHAEHSGGSPGIRPVARQSAR